MTIGQVRGVARRLLDRRVRGPMILLYHRVAELRADPQLLAVTPSRFQEHLAIIRDAFSPMSLEDMVEGVRAGSVLSNAVAVTFDDGYADNLHAARPLLDRYSVPATVFVAAGYVGSAREFWWDELERVLLGPTALPPRIVATAGGRRREWEVGEESAPAGADGWNVLSEGNPSPRHRAYREIAAVLRDLPPADRDAWLDRIAERSGAAEPRPTHLPLTEDELRLLAATDLVKIGAHTVRHPVLSLLPAESQKQEIEEGRRRLEAIVGKRVTAFAYPFGGRADFTPETVRLVREAGFSLAAANVPGVLTRSIGRYALPRLLVRNWTGEHFARRLRRPLT